MSAAMPDFQPLAYGPFAKLSGSASAYSKVKPIEPMLVEPKVELAQAVCKACPVTEMDTLTRALVLVFESHGHTIALIKTFIKQEVANNDGDGTLFRSNSAANKLMKNYAMLIGLPYLFETLAPIVREMAAAGRSHELDDSLVEDGSMANVNRYGLLSYTQRTLHEITKSVDKMPVQFRMICNSLIKEVKQRYPGQVQQACGNFIFLRFFVPAITAPDMYGLLPEPPTAETRRMLVLVGKSLQNLSNNVRFGTKEPFMVKMNDFIDSNQSTLKKFFKTVANVPQGTRAPRTQLIPRVEKHALLQVYRVMQDNQHMMINEMSELRATRVRDAVEEAMEKIGPVNINKV